MALLNSVSCKYLLHRYDPTLHPPVSTWSAIAHQFIEGRHHNEGIVTQIRKYWIMDSIHLSEDQCQSFIVNQKQMEFYDLILGENAVLTLNMERKQSEEPLRITVYNDIILHQTSRIIITGQCAAGQWTLISLQTVRTYGEDERIRVHPSDLLKERNISNTLHLVQLQLQLSSTSDTEYDRGNTLIYMPALDALEYMIRECTSCSQCDDVQESTICRGLEHIDKLNLTTSSHQSALRCVLVPILERLMACDLGMAVKVKCCIILLHLGSLENVLLSETTMHRVIAILVELFGSTRCTLRVRQNEVMLLSQLFHDVILEMVLDGALVGAINVDDCRLITHFGAYFDPFSSSNKSQSLEFVNLLEKISALDLWSRVPSIWRSFVDCNFIPKLRKCYLSQHLEVRHKACIVWAHLVNQSNIMGVSDLCPMAIKPSIDLCADEEHQRMAIQAISKMVIGQPLHVYMALDYGVLEYLIPIIVTYIRSRERGNASNDEDGCPAALEEAVDALLHLSNPNMDSKHLGDILDGLALAINVDSFESQEMLCRIYSEFTDPNQSKINKQVIDSMVGGTARYHRYDEVLMSGYLREIVRDSEINMEHDDDVWRGVLRHCVSYSRLYRNVIEFVVHSVDSFHEACAVLVHLLKLMDEEQAIQLMFEHAACRRLIAFIDSKPYFGIDNATLILSQMSEKHADHLLQHDIIGMLLQLSVSWSVSAGSKNTFWCIRSSGVRIT